LSLSPGFLLKKSRWLFQFRQTQACVVERRELFLKLLLFLCRVREKAAVRELWQERANLLREISRLLGVNAEPAEVIRMAKAVQGSDGRAHQLAFLLGRLRRVREQLFLRLRESFSGMFRRARVRFGQEGVSMLEEKLIFCIDHCRVGMESCFPAYFSRYAVRVFSEIEDERMSAGFYIPRRDKLLLRSSEASEQLRDLAATAPMVRVEVRDLADHTTPESILEAKERYAEVLRSRDSDGEEPRWWQFDHQRTV